MDHGENEPGDASAAPLAGQSAAPPGGDPSWRRSPLWDDGKAEFCAYQVTWARYGHHFEGRALLILVKEPWAPDLDVKADRLRPDGKNDPHGVELAKATLRTAYGVIEREMATKRWAMGDIFTLADCAAAPALFYADKVVPLGDAHRNTAAYLARLMERPSFARVLDEAKPYFHLLPAAST